MRNLLSLMIIAVLMGSAGCATTSNYNSRVRSWEGKNADVLVKTWGTPDATEKQSSGNKILLYTRLRHPAYAYTESQQRHIASGPSQQSAGGSTMYVKCATYFEVTPDNTVVSTFFRGDECRSKD